MKRNILTIILVLLLILAIALPVLAVDTGAQTETDNTYATAADNTKSDCLKSDSLKPEITIDDEHNITMTYSAAALKTVAADESQNRPIEAAWIGFKLTTPTEATKYNVTYKGQTSSGNITDSTVEDFVAVTADKLKEVTQAKTNLVYTIKYEWLKDAATSRAATEPAENTETISEQTLTIVIEPQGVELYDGVSAESEDVVLWDETAYTENLPKETSVSAAKPEKDTTPKTGI